MTSDIPLLVAALEAQTRAITELAESNRQVVDLLMTQQAEVDDQDEQDVETCLEDLPQR